MITDKQIIEILKNIKGYCMHNTDCYNCKFVDKRDECQIFKLSEVLNFLPCDWDIKKIEEIINE